MILQRAKITKQNDSPSGGNGFGSFRKLQIVAVCCFVLAVTAFLALSKNGISAASIKAFAGENPLALTALLWLLFVLKSMTIIVPLDSLYIAGGVLFGSARAIAVNFFGVALTMTLPFLLGRWSGREAVSGIRAKYPKIDSVISLQEHNEFLAVFLIRVIGGLPFDVVSFYFGACGMSYRRYLTASLCGCASALILTTILGDALHNPQSSSFILLLGVRTLISAAAALAAFLKTRKRNAGGSAPPRG